MTIDYERSAAPQDLTTFLAVYDGVEGSASKEFEAPGIGHAMRMAREWAEGIHPATYHDAEELDAGIDALGWVQVHEADGIRIFSR